MYMRLGTIYFIMSRYLILLVLVPFIWSCNTPVEAKENTPKVELAYDRAGVINMRHTKHVQRQQKNIHERLKKIHKKLEKRRKQRKRKG